MDEQTEKELYAWLMNRGLSVERAMSLINKIDEERISKS